MNYQITRNDMGKKMERAIHQAGNRYNLQDIMEFINIGKMQSFTKGDTWIITQIATYPRKKILEIVFVVGNLQDAIDVLSELEEFADDIGATQIAAMGRDGWWKFAEPGWRRTGSTYIKDL